MATLITASMLYDLVSCPHRVTMDIFTDPAERDAPNAFIELLWEKGSMYEQEVIEGLKVPFTDLSMYSGEEKELLTLEAMQRGDPVIYSGRVQADGLLGDPDLLRKEDEGYIAGDIKSGSGEEGPEDLSKPKKHYAVQLGLYTDILERKGLSAGKRAFIWDINGEEVIYDFAKLYGKRNPRTLWQDYQDHLIEAEAIVGQSTETLAAYSGACKLCHWYSACLSRLSEANDLTLIPELGRSKRDVMIDHVRTIQELADADPGDFLDGKKSVFPGIGPDTLKKFRARAKLISAGKNAKPYLREPVTLPAADLELYFDIEVDPMRDICYLHGFVERRDGNNDSERFIAFLAEEPTAEAEEQAFADAWRYMQESQPCIIYYYSKYERTIYRKLREKYPSVCTEDELETLFDPQRAIDLYFDIVLKATEWPTRDFSIKTLAKFLGFYWRDTHPSGAASIEWFHRWVETSDTAIRQRILDYNEDDCRATRVLRDAIDGLTLVPEEAA
ncbi:MAG: TM0106 family RecB-like putative nuclease [Tistlia sp.]|uniref:TM0106 family RecB-like putative nuclease n=1 Tax=Tistlia sp. TaxID=3057121 RepID=UPI0034A3B7E8